MPTHLTVRAKGSALVQDLEALESSPPIRRYVGRKADPSVQEGGLAFVPVADPVKVPNRHEYRRKVVEGTLEACDAETAEACFGVGWSSKWKPEAETSSSGNGDV